ncbi:heterokaryon incompatibility protein-domain-containing protein [Xylariaceae sp. FL1651]|nr:heterokaryon incompatibility protein-domain-containing protein [Xylariaceae sp. FL1651]
MWLLNACSWEMKEFISHKQTPPYAILSHTWGDGEVSFRDWNTERWPVVQGKEGFRKIDYCCQQAASDGLEWVWIDTCCIDKSSSAELSEAINSMFRWYSSATICYAYLYDVPQLSQLAEIESAIRTSYWVTRGWTLQELIAPCNVVFYSNDWHALGTRSELSASLASITRIDEAYLTGRNLEQASIAQRMSWAARRTTSREEDQAYCLLGIFNVHMPLIYGEGPRAFRRLQEILVLEYPEDHTLFAWGKVVPRLSNQVVDSEQIWGSKPIRYDPEQVDRKFFGLFAESPRDFEQSGELVCAPFLTSYFRFGRKVPGPLTLVGKGIRADFSVYYSAGRWQYAVFHLKNPPIGE